MILDPLSDNDRFMVDCLVLAVIHDETVGCNVEHVRRRMIYKNKKLEAKHFDLKGWMNIYWFTLKDDELLENYIRIAWERVKKMETAKNKSKKGQPTPRTQKSIIHEAGGKCSICPENNFYTLEIHHIKGRDVPNAHNAENLLCVCKNCHGKIHGGQITEEDVILYKEKLKTQHIRNKQKQETVSNIKIFGGNQGIVAQSIANISIKSTGKPSPKFMPSHGSIGSDLVKRNYLKYLIDRYHEYAKAEKKEKFNYAVFYQSIKREFGAKWDMVPLNRFEEVCSYAQRRIDATILGKTRKVRGAARYSTFDEYCGKHA